MILVMILVVMSYPTVCVRVAPDGYASSGYRCVGVDYVCDVEKYLKPDTGCGLSTQVLYVVVLGII
jgi:hypothetical protein